MRRALLLILPLASACYTYAPLHTSSLQTGTIVRARINAATAESIEPLLGVTDARVLIGTVVATSADSVMLDVPTVAMAQVGNSMQRLNQRVALPRSSFVDIESRQLDRFKTGAVVVATTVLATAFILRSTVRDPGMESGPGTGGGTDIRLFTVRIGW